MDYPQSPFVQDAVFFLAECELALGAPAEAEKRYQTVLSVYPASSYREAATFRLADAAWRQRRPAQALERLAACRCGFPTAPTRAARYAWVPTYSLRRRSTRKRWTATAALWAF